MKKRTIALLLTIVLVLSLAITAAASMPIGETYDVEWVKGEPNVILVPWDGESKELFSGSDPLYIDQSYKIISFVRLGPVATSETPSGRCLKYKMVGSTLGKTTMTFTNPKTGTVLATYNINVVESATPSETPKPSETVKPSETPKPSETVKPSESPKPSETVKPSESPKPSETVKPSESPKPSETVKPSESPKPSETVNPSESPKPSETVNPSESPKPSETVNPSESPKPSETVNPSESPKPSDPVDNHSDKCPSNRFSDMKNTENTWFHEGVDYVIARGYMAGVEDNLFAPHRAVSRAMVAQILYATEGKPANVKSAGFSDVKAGKWYTDAVNWAASKGVVAGYPDGTFKPDKAVTREELATILYKYAQTKTDAFGIAMDALDKFQDKDQIHAYAVNAMEWVVTNKIISGTDQGLEPRGTATRAQLAVILQAFDENVK